MEIIAVARSGMDFPLRFTIPYSVTTYIMSARVVEMTLPGICVVLLIVTTRSFCITMCGGLVRSTAWQRQSGLRSAVSYITFVPTPKVHTTLPRCSVLRAPVTTPAR
jgi:hypothetical protein